MYSKDKVYVGSRNLLYNLYLEIKTVTFLSKEVLK